MMVNILEKEVATFEREKERLLAEAEGSYVLIKGDEIAGVYREQMDAVAEGYRRYRDQRPFLVKKIERVEIPISIVSSLLAI